LNKPIIFYCPDIKNYKLSPGLALDVEKQNFAYFSKNKEQFIKQIKNFCYNKDKFCNFHNSNRLEMLDKIYPNKNFLDDIVKIIK
jgi:CDP-glycerol glycerophosphotransferase (TagB/SpsB family)